MTRPLVAIRSVSKNFGEFQALNRVSLDVGAGEVLCLIGASGSGKTTLLRCINQLTSIDSGGIWLDGELLGVREEGGRLHRLTERQIARQRLKTGMVFQRFNLFPHRTALENVTEGPIYVKNEPREDAARVARTTLDALDSDGGEAVVVPAGSCATMVKVFWPELFELVGDHDAAAPAEAGDARADLQARAHLVGPPGTPTTATATMAVTKMGHITHPPASKWRRQRGTTMPIAPGRIPGRWGVSSCPRPA
jgi:hypothetical protein